MYWFGKDEIVSETEEEIIVDKFEKRYHIEKRILKPFFKPTKADEKGMGTYSLLKTDKHIIFPYNADGSLISIDIMKEEYLSLIHIFTADRLSLRSKMCRQTE